MGRVLFSAENKAQIENIGAIVSELSDRIQGAIDTLYPSYRDTSQHRLIRDLGGELREGTILLQGGQSVTADDLAQSALSTPQLQFAAGMAAADPDATAAMERRVDTLGPLARTLAAMPSSRIDALRPEQDEDTRRSSAIRFTRLSAEFDSAMTTAVKAWQGDTPEERTIQNCLGGLRALKERLSSQLPDFSSFQAANTPSDHKALADDLIIEGGRGRPR